MSADEPPTVGNPVVTDAQDDLLLSQPSSEMQDAELERVLQTVDDIIGQPGWCSDCRAW